MRVRKATLSYANHVAYAEKEHLSRGTKQGENRIATSLGSAHAYGFE